KLWTPAEARACQEPLMKYVDLLITTEEDTKVVFGIEAPKAGDERFTNVESSGYKDVTLQLVKKFGFKAVAITLRQNTSVWFNDWWGLYYDTPSQTFFESPKHQLESV